MKFDFDEVLLNIVSWYNSERDIDTHREKENERVFCLKREENVSHIKLCQNKSKLELEHVGNRDYSWWCTDIIFIDSHLDSK